MSLNGSLETFALSDVLTLLATTCKTGQLRVNGQRVDGRLWLASGDLVASEVGSSRDYVDALFELLRLEDGTFTFSDGNPPREDRRMPVAPALAEAKARLAEWHEIAAVVPSLAIGIRLARELPDDEVIVSAARWGALVAIAEARVVGDVAERLGLGEFDGCRLIKDLADDGLVEVLGEVALAPPPPPPVELDEAPYAGGDGATAAGPDGVVDGGDEVAEGLEDTGVEAVEVSGNGLFDGTVDSGNEDEEIDPLAALTEAAAQLAAMAPPESEAATMDPEQIAAAAAAAGMPASALLEGSLPEGDFDGDEPINRGLLLKFLSSVRN